MRNRRRNVPIDERMKILREYLSGNETAREVASRHDISPHLINVWLCRYRKSGKSLPLASETKNEETMVKKSKETDPAEENELLKKRVKDLECRLHQSELQNLALNTMIDIAEEQGISIRKKSGARQ